MERDRSKPAQRGLRVIEVSQRPQRQRKPKALVVPGLDRHPEMEKIGALCEEALEILDGKIGWGDESRPKPCNDAQAFRQKMRGSLTEAILNGFAALQHQEHNSGR